VNLNIPEVSDEFVRAFMQSGSLSINCQFCDRTHFATASPNYFEDGELADLRSRAEAEPDKYIEDSCSDSILWCFLSGKQYVFGCPCGKAKDYEEFIWSHRFAIAEYFIQRAKMEKEEADHQHEKLFEAAGAAEESEIHTPKDKTRDESYDN